MHVTKARRMLSQRFGLYTVALGLVTAVALIFMWLAYVPPNPLSLPWSPSQQQDFKQFVPEGWAFFTRDPREEDFMLFGRSASGSWVNKLIGHASEPKQLFGWSRISRAQGLDLGVLASEVSIKSYASCDAASVSDCFAKLPPLVRVKNAAPHPLICGRSLLIFRKLVPWNWATFARVTMHARVANLDVICQGS